MTTNQPKVTDKPGVREAPMSSPLDGNGVEAREYWMHYDHQSLIPNSYHHNRGPKG